MPSPIVLLDLHKEKTVKTRNEPDIIGLSVEQAKKKHNWIRVVEEDGECFMYTMDYHPQRINVVVENGVIAKIVNFG